VTRLAHDAAMLSIPVDLGRLFDGSPDFVLFVETVVDRVHRTKREVAKRERG